MMNDAKVMAIETLRSKELEMSEIIISIKIKKNSKIIG